MSAPDPQCQQHLQQRLQNDDESSLADMLRSWGGDAMRIFGKRYRGVLNEADLEDILAVALFRVWRNRHGKRRQGSLRAWFFRIVDHAARDVLRYGWHKARMLERGAEAESIENVSIEPVDRKSDRPSAGIQDVTPIDPAQPPWLTNAESTEPSTLPAEAFASQAAPAEITQALRQIVATLPDTQRRIIWADACAPEHPASSDDLARELGISANSVRVYRKRAMDRIRQGLAKLGFSEFSRESHDEYSTPPR